MPRPTHLQTRSGARDGVALLAVLACILLLTILVVSFISFTKLNRVSTVEYGNSVQAQEIAQGGLQDILSDLRQEIAAGSVVSTNAATFVQNGTAIYVPVNNHTIEPAREGFAANAWGTAPTTALFSPSLIRVSRRDATAGGTSYNPPLSTANYPGTLPLNRASAVSTATNSVNGRSISAARWNKTFLLATNSVSVPSPFTAPSSASAPAGPPDWVYVTRQGSQVCTTLPIANLIPSSNLTSTTSGSGSPVVGRYAFVMYDEGALLDANVAGSPSSLISASVVQTQTSPYYSAVTYNDPTTGRSLAFSGKSYSTFADLTLLPGLSGTQTTVIDPLVNLRNAAGIAAANSSNGNTYLGAIFNYANFVPSAFTNFTSSGSTSDSPFISRQDLINYFAKIDSKFNTSAPTYSQALPYLGTFSRAVSAPSYTPPMNSSADPNYHPPTTPTLGLVNSAPVNYQAQAETTGVANRDLANVRFANNGPVVHYYDDQSSTSTALTGTYTVAAGDPLLQNRFSLAKINWLAQSWAGQADPGTTSPTYAGSNYPAAIQACFGLVWGSPGSTTTNSNTNSSTANGGNPCWNYVGSPAGAGATAATFAGTIETLDQVAKENREPNFFELLKAAILNGSLGLGPGPAMFQNGQDSTVPATYIAPFDAKYGVNPIDLQGSGSLFGYTFGPNSTAVSQWRVPDMQIVQIGANIIDQFDSDNYPTAIYFPYSEPGGAANPNDPVTGGALANAFFGPVSMIYGDENLPMLTRIHSVLASPNPISTTGAFDPSTGPSTDLEDNSHSLEGWLQPEIWNPHQMPANALVNVPHNFQIRAYGSATTYATMSSAVVGGPGIIAGATTTPAGWTGGQTAPNTSNWTRAASQPQFYWTGSTSTESASGATEQAGTISFTDTSTTSSFYSNPRMLVRNGDAATVSIPGITNVNSLAMVAGTFGTVAGNYVPVGTSTNIAYWDNVQTINGTGYVNHFVGFTTGVISEAGGVFPNQPFYIGSNYANDAGIGFVSSTAGVPGMSVAMGWTDSGSRFHPYSFITGAFVTAHLNMYNQGHPPDSRIGGAIPGSQGPLSFGNIDPRTGRFFQSNNFVMGGGPQNSSLFPNNDAYPDIGTNGAAFNAGGVPGNGMATGASNFYTPTDTGSPGAGAYPEDWMMNRTSTLTSPGQWASPNDMRTKTPQAGPAYYADPDGVVRPGDGCFLNVATGDGNMLFMSPGTGSSALGDRVLGGGTDAVPISTTASSGNARHGRRPVILNRPFRSVGELGYVFRDMPFKTLDFFTASSADAALLDVFSLTDESKVSSSQLGSVVAGQVELNNAPLAVIQALLMGASKKDVDPTYNQTAAGIPGDTTKIATVISNYLQGPGAPNPILNRAAEATSIQPTIQTVSGGVITGTTRNSILPDKYNKAYLETPVRALAGITNSRTWNLLIDVIAQSGQMAPTAQSLNDFVVQGERRYWLHVAIDRYTGKIVSQQLEPVYE